MDVGRGAYPPRILKLLPKKVVFSISRGKKQISPLLPLTPEQNWENPVLPPPPGKKSFDAHATR